MHWANFLHIYQPPTQTEEIVRKVTDECYRTLVRVIEHRDVSSELTFGGDVSQ